MSASSNRSGQPFHDALDTLGRQLVRFAAGGTWQRVWPSLLEAARTVPRVADISQHEHGRGIGVIKRVVRLGIQQGRLAAGDDPERVTLDIVGPILAATVLSNVSLDDTLVDHIIHIVPATHGTTFARDLTDERSPPGSERTR